MTPYLLVGAGGFFGAVARYGVSRYAAKRVSGPIPYGTLFVNLLGSFLLGFIAAVDRSTISLLFGTGFMGAFTTFSTLKLEGVQLWRNNKKAPMLIYYAVSYAGGILLAMLGYQIGLIR